MRSFFFVFFFSIALLSVNAGAMELTVAPAVRSYPFSASVEANLRHEYLLWDKRDEANFKFGFIQPKLTLAAHGMWEAGLNFYPISILELGAGYGTTVRFYDNKTFNCDNNICRGVVQRHRLTSRLVGGFKTDCGEAIAVLSFNRIRISTADDSQPLMDETEVLLARPGSDTFESQSVLLGLKRDDETFGIFAKKGRYLEARVENESQYLVYRKKIAQWSYAAGLGRYASDFSEPGFSAYGTVLWTWGNSISLF